MLACVAEHCFHQVRCAIGGFGLVREISGRGDEYAKLDDPFDAVKVSAQRCLHLRDEHDCARFGRSLSVFKTARVADFAGDKLAIDKGQLPRNEQHPIRFDSGHIGCDRRSRCRKSNAQFGQFCFNHHTTFSNAGAGTFATSLSLIQTSASAQRSKRACADFDGFTRSHNNGSPTKCRRHTSGCCSPTDSC